MDFDKYVIVSGGSTLSAECLLKSVAANNDAECLLKSVAADTVRSREPVSQARKQGSKVGTAGMCASTALVMFAHQYPCEFPIEMSRLPHRFIPTHGPALPDKTHIFIFI